MQKKALLRKKLAKARVDAILITDLINVRYLTGFTGSSGYSIITERDALFITDFRYKEQARGEVKGFKIIIENAERTGEIKKYCESYRIRTLGFEDHNVNYGLYRKLVKRKIRLKQLTNVIEQIRITKTEQELYDIRTAVKRAESAFRKLQPFIMAGTTEKKLALKLEGLLKSEGCKTLPFEVIVASGPTAALPHAQPTERKLRGGDLVVIDWGGECKGYTSDMTRTVLLKGRSISKQKELYYNVLEAQKRAIFKVQPGVNAADIDRAARTYIKQTGYDEYFGHGTGHGVGLAVHEKPVVSWRSREVIKENMVFTVEPGIYLPGFGGVRIEDMVAAKKGGADVMTSLPKKLKIIER
ncbi:MAG: aminopeptidase P family protein [Nitrospiraceae bacterium]|nr:MAG: aminopeptidase P family protein [Nitrospiraceae bacterium]